MGFIWYIIIGIVAGFLAGKIMRGGGFGLVINLLLGWDYYSERCLEYLSGGRMKYVKVYRWIYILAVFIGPYMTVSAVDGGSRQKKMKPKSEKRQLERTKSTGI